jgi:hypothetical protein
VSHSRESGDGASAEVVSRVLGTLAGQTPSFVVLQKALLGKGLAGA